MHWHQMGTGCTLCVFSHSRNRRANWNPSAIGITMIGENHIGTCPALLCHSLQQQRWRIFLPLSSSHPTPLHAVVKCSRYFVPATTIDVPNILQRILRFTSASSTKRNARVGAEESSRVRNSAEAGAEFEGPDQTSLRSGCEGCCGCSIGGDRRC